MQQGTNEDRATAAVTNKVNRHMGQSISAPLGSGGERDGERGRRKKT